jgi:hypothetical protein
VPACQSWHNTCLQEGKSMDEDSQVRTRPLPTPRTEVREKTKWIAEL